LKTFRSLVVLKRPQQELWTVMRDHLVEFAANIADIEEIRQIDRNVAEDGTVHIVNEWRVRQKVPTAVLGMLKIGEISWIDRAAWNGTSCTWRIEPSFLREHIDCHGETEFATAMAGRGTRVTFAGELDLQPALFASLGALGPTVSGFVESLVTTIIPRNLRAVVEAAAEFPLPL
jgi:hypothetical protein